jgi:hypothetical protein
MAGSVILTSLSQLQEQRKGFEALSITNFDTVDTTAPQIALGSRIEIAGSVVQFTANESLVGFAGLGVGVAYAYIDGVALTANWTATAPTWSTEKQAYYDVTGANRYFLRCLKDAGGNYLQKALYTNKRGILRTYTGLALNPGANGDQEIRFATDASILWDESEDEFISDKRFHSALQIGSAHGFKPTGLVSNNITAENTLFDALSPYISNTGDKILTSGGATTLAYGDFIVSQIERTAPTTMKLYGFSFSTGVLTVTITDGGATNIGYSIAF